MGFKLMRGGSVNRQWVDRAKLDYAPTNYTPTLTPGESERPFELASHLKGIDDSIVGGTKTFPNNTLEDIDGYSIVANPNGTAGTRQEVNRTELGVQASIVNGDGLVGWKSTGVLSEFDATTVGRPSFLSKWALGKRYFTSSITGADTISGGEDAYDGRIYYSQIYVPEKYNLNRMSIEVLSGTGLGRNIRFALYSDSSGEPASLLYDSTNVSASSVGIKFTTTVLPTVEGGNYWFALQASSSALKITAATLTATGPYLGEKDDATAFAQGITMITEAFVTFGAFPASTGTLTEVTKALGLIGMSRSAS